MKILISSLFGLAISWTALSAPANAQASQVQLQQMRETAYSEAIAAHPFKPVDYKKLRVCAESGLPPRDPTPNSVFRYYYERTVFDAAGVKDAYEDAIARAAAKGDKKLRFEPLNPAIQQRIKKMWEDGLASGANRCFATQFTGGDPLKQSVFMFEMRLPMDAIYEWGIDPNLMIGMEPSLLDTVLSRREHDDNFRYLEEILRDKGALKRDEMQAKGMIRSVQRMKQDDFSTALANAEKGNAAAMFEVGSRLGSGVGVKRDIVAAERWLTKAATAARQAGDNALLFNIGVAYTEEIANRRTLPDALWVPSDYKKAAEYMRPAAEAGGFEALQLGKLYDSGGPGNPVEAGRLYTLAMNYKDPTFGKFNLGRLIANGRLPGGVAKANELFTSSPAPLVNPGLRGAIVTWQCSHKLYTREVCEKEFEKVWGDYKPMP